MRAALVTLTILFVCTASAFSETCDDNDENNVKGFTKFLNTTKSALSTKFDLDNLTCETKPYLALSRKIDKVLEAKTENLDKIDAVNTKKVNEIKELKEEWKNWCIEIVNFCKGSASSEFEYLIKRLYLSNCKESIDFTINKDECTESGLN